MGEVMTKRVGLRLNDKQQTLSVARLINDRRTVVDYGMVSWGAYHVHLRDNLALFVHLTCLLLFHSHHWPIPQSLPSKYVQNQMPLIDTYSNSTILIVQLSDGGGATGGAIICQGGGPPWPTTWSRHWTNVHWQLQLTSLTGGLRPT